MGQPARRTPEQREAADRRFWTAAGLAQLAALAVAGQIGPVVAGVAFSLTGKTGFDMLRELAESEEPSLGRAAARKVIALLFGIKGRPDTRFRRRLTDLLASLALALLIGGGTATALMGAAAGGAAMSIISSRQGGAEKEWQEEGKGAPMPSRKPWAFGW